GEAQLSAVQAVEGEGHLSPDLFRDRPPEPLDSAGTVEIEAVIPLDLDDLGTEIREVLAHHGTGPHPAQLDDPDALKRKSRRHRSAHRNRGMTASANRRLLLRACSGE